MKESATVCWTFSMLWNVDQKRYTIHGLWPEMNMNRSDTSMNMYDAKMMDPKLISELERNWSSTYHRNVNDMNETDREKTLLAADEKFWEHEWNKHGRISGFTEMQYFETTLNLYHRYRNETPTSDQHHQIRIHLDRSLNEIQRTFHGEQNQ